MSDSCLDCNQNIRRGDMYMVTGAVWKASGAPDSALLCVSCLEKRLGRELVPADFTFVGINILPMLDAKNRRNYNQVVRAMFAGSPEAIKNLTVPEDEDLSRYADPILSLRRGESIRALRCDQESVIKLALLDPALWFIVRNLL